MTIDQAFHAIGDRVRAGEYRNLHAVLALRGDDLVFEAYLPGPDENLAEIIWGRNGEDFHPGGLHDIRSVTKTVTSLLYGIALEAGDVPEIDEPVVDLFREHADLMTAEWERIRVRHVLTMTMGIEWDESISYADPRNSEIQMHGSEDPYRYVLSRPVVAEPGEQFTYCGGATELIADLVQRGTGRRIDEFARDVLFSPLGITDLEWAAPRHGHPMAASGLRLRARDLASIARLVVTRGGGIVSEEWIARSLQLHVKNDVGGYGFHWWLSETGRIASGVGNGGQRALVIPESDIVCVIFAGNYNETGPSESDRMITECVLPAAGLPAVDTWWNL